MFGANATALPVMAGGHKKGVRGLSETGTGYRDDSTHGGGDRIQAAGPYMVAQRAPTVKQRLLLDYGNAETQQTATNGNVTWNAVYFGHRVLVRSVLGLRPAGQADLGTACRGGNGNNTPQPRKQRALARPGQEDNGTTTTIKGGNADWAGWTSGTGGS